MWLLKQTYEDENHHEARIMISWNYSLLLHTAASFKTTNTGLVCLLRVSFFKRTSSQTLHIGSIPLQHSLAYGLNQQQKQKEPSKRLLLLWIGWYGGALNWASVCRNCTFWLTGAHPSATDYRDVIEEILYSRKKKCEDESPKSALSSNEKSKSCTFFKCPLM